MYKTFVKILLEIYVFDYCKLYENDVVRRFKENIYSYLSLSLNYEDFRSKLSSLSLLLPKSSWIMIRDFIFYIDNFEIKD